MATISSRIGMTVGSSARASSRVKCLAISSSRRAFRPARAV
jgi:hypothetical protein